MTGSVLARERRAAPVRPAWGERGAGTLVAWLCGGLALAIAAVLYTRFSWNGRLWRDESIYIYEAQRLLHGVAPYASIFDPKTPLAGMLYALGIAAGRGVGLGDVHAVRVLSLGLSLAAVVGIYLLVLALWRSPLAALAGAVAFASFHGFAMAALSGPDAKTPGVLAGVVCLLLAVRGRWFWAGFAGALAALVWQPFGAYVLVAIAGAWFCGDRERGLRRVLAPIAGALVPLVAVVLYFLASGALGKLVEAAVVFPLTGVRRGPHSPGVLLTRILDVVRAENGLRGAVVLWSGVVLLAVLVVQRRSWRDPFTVVVVPAFLLLAGYSLHDFQGGGDLFPLFPFGAIGVGGAVALLLAGLRRLGVAPVGVAVAAALIVALTVLAWRDFTSWYPTRRLLVSERTNAAQLDRLAGGRRGRLWALGDPTALVLQGRTNPSRFVYLGSGVARWHVHHLPHHMWGWRHAIRLYRPAVIPFDGWIGGQADRMLAWLHRNYASTDVGRWTVFLSPAAARRARHEGLRVAARLPLTHG